MKKHQKRSVGLNTVVSHGMLLITMLISTVLPAQYNYDNQYYGEQNDQRYSAASGLAGDNFSLEGALELFRQSSSPEAFEKALNDERNNVNNLDLDRDGYIDYLRVIDRMQGVVHAVIIQAVLGRNDVQDIAVIEIEKKDHDEVAIQIVGDEDIYGENVIIEPRRPEYDDNWYGYNNSYRYSDNAAYGRRYAYYNAWDWPVVRYIYSPRYVVWVSPWSWNAYPVWYSRWQPWGWNTFYDHCHVYRRHYVIIYHPVIYRARECYSPYRSHSTVVINHYGSRINTYRAERTPAVDRPGGFRIYDRPAGVTNVASRDNRPQRGAINSGTAQRVSPPKATSPSDDRPVRATTARPERGAVQSPAERVSTPATGTRTDRTASERPTRVQSRNDQPSSSGTVAPRRTEPSSSNSGVTRRQEQPANTRQRESAPVTRAQTERSTQRNISTQGRSERISAPSGSTGQRSVAPSRQSKPAASSNHAPQRSTSSRSGR